MVAEQSTKPEKAPEGTLGGPGDMAKEQPRSPEEPPVVAELRALVRQAQEGGASVLPRIREILDEHPEIWRHVGNLGLLVERAWLSVLTNDDSVGMEALRRSIEELRADLAGAHPTRLEKMLVDQVIANWLEVKHAESVSADPGPASLDQAAFCLKRLESAQRRYGDSIKSLATIRQLLPKGLAPSQGISLYEPRAKRA